MIDRLRTLRAPPPQTCPLRRLEIRRLAAGFGGSSPFGNDGETNWRQSAPVRHGKRRLPGESAAQIPNSGPNAFTLSPVTSQPNDGLWQRPGEAEEPVPARPATARVVDPEDDLTPVGY